MSLHKKTVERSAHGILVIRVPMNFRKRGGRKEVVLPQGVQSPEDTASSLQLAIARAFCWQRMLDSGEVESISALASRERLHKAHVCRMLRFTLLAPDIIEGILAGKETKGLSIIRLRDQGFPVLWEAQREMWGRDSLPGV